MKPDQTSTRQRPRPGAGTVRVHKTGPDETPAEAGKDIGTDTSWEARETRLDHCMGQTSSRQEPGPSGSTDRVHETGPDKTRREQGKSESRDGFTTRTRYPPDKRQVPTGVQDIYTPVRA